MPTPDVQVIEILEGAASLNNDSAQTTYTNEALLSYLNIALRDLQEYFELNDMPVTEDTSAEVEVDAGIVAVGFDTVPALPSNLIEIKQLWQRQRGIDPYVPLLPKMEFLPRYLAGQETSIILAWVWQANEIRFLPSNSDLDLKIDYNRALFTKIQEEDIDEAIIHVINSESFLTYRTGSLAARFIGEDKPRADELDGFAQTAIEMSAAIGIKGKQMIATRRRPFMASYKSRNIR